MQAKKAAELREKWGDKYCNHPDWDNEYILGSQTGDSVCTQCGLTVWNPKEAQEEARKKLKSN